MNADVRPTVAVPSGPQRLLADPLYPALKEHVIRTTGLDYYTTRDDELCTNLYKRMSELGSSDCLSYLQQLAEGAGNHAERDRLVEMLTIGETFFFRHKELFDALRDRVFPYLIERNRDTRRLRIWCAGCSIGAEPYSISILLKRDLAAALAGWDVTILGTDINRSFLRRAQAAAFEDWALRNVPHDVRSDCFTNSDGSSLLAPSFREGVRFLYHNLVEDPFVGPDAAGGYDLVLCRNVMIYFDRESIVRVADGLYDTLAPGGWLLVGYAEPHVEMFRKFRTINEPGAVLYQKPDVRQGPVAGCPLQLTTDHWQRTLIDRGSSQHRKKNRRRFETSAPAQSTGRHARRQPDPESTSEKAHRLAAIRSLLKEGNLQPAFLACRELIVKFKLDASAHFHHGLVLCEIGAVDDACQALKRAIYLDRQHAPAHYRLGLLHLQQGRTLLAERSFRTVCELLASRNPHQRVADCDGLTTAELSGLAAAQLGGCVRT